MPLPDFNDQGDLPVAIHRATFAEVIERFDGVTPQRQLVTKRLIKVHTLAQHSGYLARFIIFGSYITDKPAPNDVDIILVMRDDFIGTERDADVAVLFDHAQAQRELGASIFWTTPSGILLGTLEDFIAHWQVKRDFSKRGIVEVINEVIS